MGGSAKITSTDAVRHFKVALQEYEAELRDAITQLLLEMRRAIDWLEHDRARYWPQEVRNASDALVQARSDLSRAETSIGADDRRSNYEKKLAYEAAKRRLRNAEQKVRAIRKWRVELRQRADEFEGRLGRLANFLDADLPRGVAALERMAVALDKYTERAAPSEAGPGNTGAESSSDTPEENEP
ncbi:MAG: hypothetical protein H8E44_08640 [Planctomycetes bacterium]|nr:hypothetical protein [Planctomycetota bacterium]MBL7043393.1 hypothetical protein [Pirellulaceae bacterium]